MEPRTGAAGAWPGCSSIAFLVLGIPLAVPSRLGSPVEFLRGLADVGLGALFAWKDLVTVDLPVGTYRNLLVPALIVFLVGTCAGLLLSWRADRVGVRAPCPWRSRWSRSGCSSAARP